MNDLWRHEKTGRIYRRICEAALESDPTVRMVVYQLEDSAELPWARNEFEFYDGRFTPLMELGSP